MQMLLVVVAAAVGMLSAPSAAASIGNHITYGPVRDLLSAAGLLDMLRNGAGPYTVFIPSDMYFSRFLSQNGISLDDLKQDPVALKDMLLYHMVNGTIMTNELYNERKLTAMNGQVIRVNNYHGRITLQGAAMQGRGYRATNGVIHYLYAPLEAANGTVVDVLQGESTLSTLVTAAQAAGVVEFLIDQNPITVFAPTDAAFSALGSKVQTLLGNPQLLAEILKYHVVPGTLYTAGLHNVDLHTFEETDKLHLQSIFGGAFTLDGGHLLRGGVDMSATNGVVHEIDKVLIPESLKDQI